MSLTPFLDAAPAFILRMFACDCAERLFWRERMRANEPKAIFWDALTFMRRSQTEKTEDAQRIKHHEPFLRAYGNTRGEPTRPATRSFQQMGWAITHAEPKVAAKAAAQALLTLAPNSDATWALGRLTWLIGTHQWAGERMAFLLPEGEIDTPQPMKIRP